MNIQIATTIADKYWIPLSLEKFEMQEVDKRTNINSFQKRLNHNPNKRPHTNETV